MTDIFKNQIKLPGWSKTPATIQDTNGRCYEVTGFEEDIGNLTVFENSHEVLEAIPCCEMCDYDLEDEPFPSSSSSSSSSSSWSTEHSSTSTSTTQSTDEYDYDYGYDGYYGYGPVDPEYPCPDGCCETGAMGFGFTLDDCVHSLTGFGLPNRKQICADDCGPPIDPEDWILCDPDYWARLGVDIPGVWSCGFCCDQKPVVPNEPCDPACCTTGTLQAAATKVECEALLAGIIPTTACNDACQINLEEWDVCTVGALVWFEWEKDAPEQWSCGYCCGEIEDESSSSDGESSSSDGESSSSDGESSSSDGESSSSDGESSSSDGESSSSDGESSSSDGESSSSDGESSSSEDEESSSSGFDCPGGCGYIQGLTSYGSQAACESAAVTDCTTICTNPIYGFDGNCSPNNLGCHDVSGGFDVWYPKCCCDEDNSSSSTSSSSTSSPSSTSSWSSDGDVGTDYCWVLYGTYDYRTVHWDVADGQEDFTCNNANLGQVVSLSYPDNVSGHFDPGTGMVNYQTVGEVEKACTEIRRETIDGNTYGPFYVATSGFYRCEQGNCC